MESLMRSIAPPSAVSVPLQLNFGKKDVAKGFSDPQHCTHSRRKLTTLERHLSCMSMMQSHSLYE